MQKSEYLEELVRLGRQLRPDAAAKAAAARQTADTSENGLRLFKEIDVDRIMRVVAGAQALGLRQLERPRRRALGCLEVPTDSLGALGLGHDELAHTRLIASFMGADTGTPPQIAAGCTARFVELIMSRFTGDESMVMNAADLVAARVQAERSLGADSRVDVALESSTALLFVEAKIYAKERASQLDDYWTHLRSHGRGRKTAMVFLTWRSDQRASSQAPHVHTTFRDLLQAWLPVAANERDEADDLCRYLKAIALHLYGAAARGRFESWPLHVQRKALKLVTEEVRDGHH
jgi:hypothetical protein